MNVRSYRTTHPESSRIRSAATNSGSLPKRARYRSYAARFSIDVRLRPLAFEKHEATASFARNFAGYYTALAWQFANADDDSECFRRRVSDVRVGDRVEFQLNGTGGVSFHALYFRPLQVEIECRREGDPPWLVPLSMSVPPENSDE
ncbi:hypothetical protein [Actinoplanes sp. NPDC049118]|uniref:hypothetical protein n=1 Tax=Actinoplanes sp. NPDC049118 TaxID=3155769 RepID=UPI0033CBFADE